MGVLQQSENLVFFVGAKRLEAQSVMSAADNLEQRMVAAPS
jgi:hypothetical protein